MAAHAETPPSAQTISTPGSFSKELLAWVRYLYCCASASCCGASLHCWLFLTASPQAWPPASWCLSTSRAISASGSLVAVHRLRRARRSTRHRCQRAAPLRRSRSRGARVSAGAPQGSARMARPRPFSRMERGVSRLPALLLSRQQRPHLTHRDHRPAPRHHLARVPRRRRRSHVLLVRPQRLVLPDLHPGSVA